MHTWIDLEQRSDGWYYGYMLSLGANPPDDGDDGIHSYSDGVGFPIEAGPFKKRSDALYEVASVMLNRLPKLGLDCPSHNQRREYLKAWLIKMAPQQMELF